ncbi:NAD(P)H:quinone oxidoreductase [Methanoplanus sp. FWC-SCC4]|uniref:NAD(P)H:quinone oxidoreductase n=2 Tax=Methanochimaera problematica TaxID=2609417 RepID=A0AA97FF11_9EURY|nr:NAD(P)H:quinone oxidoreductase [Methanoplanus sp. FWC-SCC4]
MTGHMHKLAEAVCEGIRDAGCTPRMYRVPETLPEEVLVMTGAKAFQEDFLKIPEIKRDELSRADAVIFGTPTRFGNMCGQMRQFLDSTGGLWKTGGLTGKVGSVFTSSATQHGGQESTILTTQITLQHHGMIIAGLPYLFEGQSKMDEITGCSPYGASTITGSAGERMPSENELSGARTQGRYVAEIAKALAPKRDEILKIFSSC